MGQIIERLTQPPEPSQIIPTGNLLVGARNQRVHLNLQQFKESLQNPNSNPMIFCQGFLKFDTLFLDGKGRIELVNPQSAGDLLQPPQSSFQALICDETKRHEVRRIVAEAFGCYFVLDPNKMGQLRLRAYLNVRLAVISKNKEPMKRPENFMQPRCQSNQLVMGLRHSQGLSLNSSPAIRK